MLPGVSIGCSSIVLMLKSVLDTIRCAHANYSDIQSSPPPHSATSSLHHNFSLYLAPSMYSAVGFSYLAQKKRFELRASQEQSLLISSRRRLTDWTSMLV